MPQLAGTFLTNNSNNLCDCLYRFFVGYSTTVVLQYVALYSFWTNHIESPYAVTD